MARAGQRFQHEGLQVKVKSTGEQVGRKVKVCVGYGCWGMQEEGEMMKEMEVQWWQEEQKEEREREDVKVKEVRRGDAREGRKEIKVWRQEEEMEENEILWEGGRRDGGDRGTAQRW